MKATLDLADTLGWRVEQDYHKTWEGREMLTFTMSYGSLSYWIELTKEHTAKVYRPTRLKKFVGHEQIRNTAHVVLNDLQTDLEYDVRKHADV